MPCLRDRITIRPDSRTADNPNPDYTGESLVSDLCADVESISGGETIEGRQVEPTITYVVTIRNRTDVTPRMRVEVDTGDFRGEVLNIGRVRRIRPRGEPPMLELHCTGVE